MRLGLGLGIPYSLGGPKAAAFSPLDLSPVLWLDASDTSTITESGGAVSQWDDKSGNGNDVVQATAAAQPTTGTRTINGLNVIDFDGSADYLRTASASSTITSPLSMFVVSHVDSGNQDMLIDSRTAASRITFFYQSATNLRIIATNTVSIAGANTTGVDHILTAVVNGASSEILVDAATYGTGDAGAAKNYEPATIGANYLNSYLLDGAIGEVVVVPTVDSGDIAAMHSYLADKWGITI